MKCNSLKSCCENHFKPNQPFDCDNNRNCVAVDDRRKIVMCSEKKKVYYYHNTEQNRVLLHHIDGGVVDDLSISKCDYMLSIRKPSGIIARLIELKGVDVAHAMEQISSTLYQFDEYFSSCQNVSGRIVASQCVPNIMATPRAIKLKRELSKYHGDLVVTTMKMDEKDTGLV